MNNMQEVKCKYCGCKLSESYTSRSVCTKCYNKLKLVRKLLKMVKDTFERCGGKENGTGEIK